MNIDKIKKFQTGFRQFISKGDVVKLAIAFIMSQLFTKIVNSLSVDIIMPPINLLLNSKYSIKDWKWNLNEKISINYGNFIENVFEFFLVSICIYTFVISFYQKLIKKSYEEENKKNKLQSDNNKKIEELEKEKIIILQEIREILSKKH
ncbi:MAG: large conductance mechanosensitive channel protein MscL [Candidatus Phytoplasma stylosanthis]|uniref:large conductance mechanosensitive channel protein MscL n=1 Tax=Candidatus Phytoplasma stylosanthis TaxID=2798314 RepID=UPI00293A5736|nr:large conductance mechanosensitive channel protein MscL [Candidatus Phytoplasma stylosanthis]MDV3168031.1 large conductance mechanosensitive channel protein MscL [Candidatus Phytoplasma stylosanthis]MDV3170795.1 large conductance mechanosensitive channel protein MscL [Candidatus Phytoplasma stylosanthis]MDV3173642.1 large conductance mechanosensitive channel protein MscL [Candidatus Phytoplasma stylosanthis]MDV3174191.1 large conductance mechanosensitive channel protein MscL [Candidatus Phyt